MSCTRRFRACDLLRFNAVNLDHLTETYNLQFYLKYLLQWPDLQQVVAAPGGKSVMAYIIGKTEGQGTSWHGHVSAVTVAPEYRRLGLASSLMNFLERVCQDTYNCYFIDLFVRRSNQVAIALYMAAGYIVYRTILNYYLDEEDAHDMRKALARDKDKKSMIPIKKPVRPEDVELTM